MKLVWRQRRQLKSAWSQLLEDILAYLEQIINQYIIKQKLSQQKIRKLKLEEEYFLWNGKNAPLINNFKFIFKIDYRFIENRLRHLVDLIEKS